eukprot:1196486-Pyramimonas_sp.AAC.1
MARAEQQKWEAAPPSWKGVRGPVAATWLSLRRVVWDVLSSAVFPSVDGQCDNAMQVAPQRHSKVAQ